MRKLLFGATSMLLVLSGSAEAQTVPPGPIVWQLKNPFRYFTNADHTGQHRKEFLALTEQEAAEPILSLERKLAAKTAGGGWADAVFENVMDEACWYSHPKEQPAPKAKSKAPCGAYLKPASYAILLSAPSVSGACTWGVAGQVLPVGDCRKTVTVNVPYGVKTEVMLGTPGQPAFAKDTIEVEDLLVVGLGDSFAAGEGNPDRPVAFKRRRVTDYDATLSGYPLRDGLKLGANYKDKDFPNKGAGWVHRRCHRSLYSHQLRVALQLAIEDPAQHRAVTFVGLACTGATILDLFKVYGGHAELPSTADKTHSSRKYELSQLDVLSHILCAENGAKLDEQTNYNVDQRLELGEDKIINIYKCDPDKQLRKVDLLLLSIGGNDVGFSGLVANASLKDESMLLPELFKEDPRIEPEQAKAYLIRLPKRYEALNDALVAMLGKEASSRILLTAYPRMGSNEEGNTCSSGTRGLDVTKIWGMDEDIVSAVEAFVDNDLMPVMEKAATDSGWTFVKEPRTGDKFKTRGICAVAKDEGADPALTNVRFPRYRTDVSVPGWFPYKPDQFKAYASRQRWYRTPNDAFLTTNFHDRKSMLPDLLVTTWTAYSGAFHPTAEGQAAIADSVLKEARKILEKKSQPQ